MRAALVLALGLCCASPARAGDAVDLVPRTAKDTIWNRGYSLTIRLRGTMEVERTTRAVTVQVDEEAAFRDTILEVNEQKRPTRIERHCARWDRTATIAIAGIASKTEREVEPAEGKTETRDDTMTSGFFVELLERAVNRAGVSPGDTWTETPRSGAFESTEVICKLSSVSTIKGERTAKVYVTLKVKGSAENSIMEATVRGYAYFSLERERIVRSDLKGTVKMKVDKVGTVFGTMREKAEITPGSRDG